MRIAILVTDRRELRASPCRHRVRTETQDKRCSISTHEKRDVRRREPPVPRRCVAPTSLIAEPKCGLCLSRTRCGSESSRRLPRRLSSGGTRHLGCVRHRFMQARSAFWSARRAAELTPPRALRAAALTCSSTRRHPEALCLPGIRVKHRRPWTRATPWKRRPPSSRPRQSHHHR